MLKKVVIIGPESTGKSTLCTQLAAHYKTLWCPEYAREYLLKHGTNYTFDDLAVIAKGQLALEDEYEKKVRKSESPKDGKLERRKVRKTESREDRESESPDAVAGTSPGLPDSPTSDSSSDSRLLFIDTDMYVMKVWCEFVFGRCHDFILKEIVNRKYDLYLLCNTDLPWVKDELREYPDPETRERLFKIYKDILVNQDTPWAEIQGNDAERLSGAVNALHSILKV